MAAHQIPAVPEAVAPPPGHPRFPLFDSLRAIAALSILVVHAALFTGVFPHASYRRLVAHLDIGVTIFFVISGFLLYRPFLAARVLRAPRTSLATYARRRFLRIAPAYWLALTALAVFPGIYGVFTGNWWVYYGLLQNYPVYTRSGQCATDIFRCGIAPAWSLAVEVLFYAVLPLFAFGMARLTRGARRASWLGIELGVLAVLSAASVWIQSGKGVPSDLLSYLVFSPLGRAWWFGLGMALAAASVRVEERGRPPRALAWAAAHPGVAWIAAGGLYVLASLVFLDPGPSLAAAVVPLGQYLGEYVLFGAIAALVVLPAVVRDREGGLPRRILAHRIPSWLGLISYGIFLWHFPILYTLSRSGVKDWWPGHSFPVVVVLTLLIAVACASLSYYLVERPLMRLKNRRGDDASRLGGLVSPGRHAPG